MPLSRHSVGPYQEMSSHPESHQGTLSHSRLGCIANQLISNTVISEASLFFTTPETIYNCQHILKLVFCCEFNRYVMFRLAEPLWTDPGLKRGISVRELISNLKTNKKKRRRRMNGRTLS